MYSRTRIKNWKLFSQLIHAGKANPRKTRLHSLRKKSMLHLVLGGAAVYRCDNLLVFDPALAAEVRRWR
jgi:hypothetical protein